MRSDDRLLEVFDEVVAAVAGALAALDDWGPSGRKLGQYQHDLVADAAAVRVLEAAGLGVLSEESGLHHPDRPVWVALDPVDGSTNASRGLPWYATSLCAIDAEGPRAALVVNQATGERFDAVRGGGARHNGDPAGPSGCQTMHEAVLGVTGAPPLRLASRQIRALGAAALDICSVATGALDAYIDWSRGAHGPWDYLGAALVCQEAGAMVADAAGRDLVLRQPDGRRIPVAAATPALFAEAVEVRASQL